MFDALFLNQVTHITSVKATGFGQLWFFDNWRVHLAAVRPSLVATALKNCCKLSRSDRVSSAVMPTSRNTIWGLALTNRLLESLLSFKRTRMFPGYISASIKLSSYRITVNALLTKSCTIPSVDANLGQHTNALDRAARERARCSSSCVERSDRSKGPVRPVAGENRRRPTNANPGGTPSG